MSLSNITEEFIREKLAGAKAKQFHAYSIPSGVEHADLAEYWDGLNYGGQESPNPAVFLPEKFKAASGSILQLRELARAGKLETDARAAREAGKRKVVLGEAMTKEEEAFIEVAQGIEEVVDEGLEDESSLLSSDAEPAGEAATFVPAEDVVEEMLDSNADNVAFTSSSTSSESLSSDEPSVSVETISENEFVPETEQVIPLDSTEASSTDLETIQDSEAAIVDVSESSAPSDETVTEHDDLGSLETTEAQTHDTEKCSTPWPIETSTTSEVVETSAAKVDAAIEDVDTQEAEVYQESPTETSGAEPSDSDSDAQADSDKSKLTRS